MVIGICGGDLRMAELANLAAARGDRVFVTGFDSGAVFSDRIFLSRDPAVLSSCDRVILPLPVSRDNEFLFAPFAGAPIPLSALWPLLLDVPFVFAGKVEEAVKENAAQKGILLQDYLTREDFAVANALPTAEGAIQIAMEQLRCTLADAPCLVLGYGRVAMVLSHLLKSLSPRVTVSCRNIGALTLAEAMGNKTIHLPRLLSHISDFSLIFNTIPARILPESHLRAMRQDALILELASAPGGADPALCRKLGIKLVSCQSLPGKVAPVTGGRIILETTDHMAAEQAEREERR